MELRPHQQKALDNVNEIFAEDNKAIVVHPTGTGKTYIALELFRQNKDKKMVFVSPSSAIIGQLKASIAKEFGVKSEDYKKVFPNLEITTYQQINSDFKKSETYAQDFDADLVVFDEAHHTAATEWGKNAKALMSSHPETNFLGLTATPQRPDGIDVVKEVFDGNLADEITLEEAVATGLLKMPNYVTALYSYEPLIEEIEAGLEAIQDKYPEKYLMLKKDMEIAKNLLEKSHGLPEIFAKHMVKKDGKYIVFCKDINHLNRMVEAAKTQGWFDGVNENVEILAIHSEEDDKTNAKVLKRFRENHVATDNTLRILFSVEKINEGLHLDDIAGEIMLRPTRSKIVYRQQLGRAMSISASAKKGRAVVFDIVDNIDSFDDIKDFIDGVRELGGGHLDGEDPFDDFYVADEVREARDALRRIAGELEVEWEDFYQRSAKWREEHNGQAPKPNLKNSEEYKTYAWERCQVLKYLRDYQDVDEKEIPETYRERIVRLKQLGLEYVPRDIKTLQEKIDAIEQYVIENGQNITTNLVLEDGTKIGEYVADVRKAYKQGKLSENQIAQLEKVGFVWDAKANLKTMQMKIDIVEQYARENGVGIKTTLVLEDGTPIGNYARAIRREYTKGTLSSEQISQLDRIGFIWRIEVSIQEKIDIVEKYARENGVDIKTALVLEDGTPIGRYVNNIRKEYASGQLTAEQILQLESIGFVWNTKENEKSMQEKIDIVEKYVRVNGTDISTSLILEDGTKIGVYINAVRTAYVKGKLTTEQIAQLEGAGFVWNTKENEKSMQEKIDMVEKYVRANGADISTKIVLEDGTKIGRYIAEIRRAYVNNSLSNNQIAQLEGVGFVWNAKENEKSMQEKIDIVEKYVRANGADISVYLVLEDGTQIGMYVRSIRKAYRKGKLTEEEIEQLDSVGFIWSARELKSLQQQKEKELAETRQLKTQAEQAESLDTQTQAALDQAIDEQTKNPKGPGE